MAFLLVTFLWPSKEKSLGALVGKSTNGRNDQGTETLQAFPEFVPLFRRPVEGRFFPDAVPGDELLFLCGQEK